MTVPVRDRVAIMFEGVSAILVSSEFVVPPDFSLRCDRFLLISPDGTSTRYDRGVGAGSTILPGT